MAVILLQIVMVSLGTHLVNKSRSSPTTEPLSPISKNNKS